MRPPRLVPTASDVIRTIGETLERVILPALGDLPERSAATTMGHLLRHVALRIDREGQMLFDDVKRLDDVLTRSAAWLDAREEAAAASLALAIRQTLAAPRDPDVYPDLARLAEAAALRRQQVSDTLDLLLRSGGESRDAAAEVLHGILLDYIAWQIEQEAGIVEAAFLDRGPRR